MSLIKKSWLEGFDYSPILSHNSYFTDQSEWVWNEVERPTQTGCRGPPDCDSPVDPVHLVPATWGGGGWLHKVSKSTCQCTHKTSWMQHIVGKRESAHAKLEANTTLCTLLVTYKYTEKSPVHITRRARFARQLELMQSKKMPIGITRWACSVCQ